MIKRRRTEESSLAASEEPSNFSATSPETRLRRAKRSDSNPPSAKVSLLTPSTPLHMTTRAASRAATDSAANSVQSADSRRSSLAGTTPFGNGSDDEERPAKRTRSSIRNDVSPNHQINEDNGPDEADDFDDAIASSQDSNNSPQKRKRESPDILDSIEATPKDVNGDEVDAQDEQQNGTEEPPAKRPARGRRKGLGLLDVHASTYTPSDVSAVNSPTLAPGNGYEPEGPTGDQALDKPVKRLPGRRRAPHANVHIEADLRRQLSLKMGYRAIVKQLKPILAELSRRSVESVDDTAEAYKESEQYQEVEDGLTERLRSRLDQLHHAQKYAKDEQELLLAADRQIIEDTYQNCVRKLKEDYEIKVKYAMLKVMRANMAAEDADATEDEDGPIPAFRAPTTKYNDGYILASGYDSRGRFFMETDRIWDELALLEAVRNKRKGLTESDDESVEELDLSGFATYEPAEREAVEAIKKRRALLAAVEVSQNQQIAEDLAAEVENRKTKDGLDILAAASEQQRLRKLAKPVQPQQTTPRTPKPTRGTQSRRGSLEDRSQLLEDSGAARSSTKRQNGRTLRSPETSPAKQQTPQQPISNPASTPRMSSNKISDLLNNDQPNPLPTIAESSPAVPAFPSSMRAPSEVIDTVDTTRHGVSLLTEPLVRDAATTFRGQQSQNQIPGGSSDTVKNAGSQHTQPENNALPPHHVDRRASDSAAMRPRLDINPPAPPQLNFAGSSKPTTFDGSGSTVSPTFSRQPPFHSRTSSLGSRPGRYAQEARNAVVPPQMSGRRESQRDHDQYKVTSVEPHPAPQGRPADDPYFRRSEPSTPAGRIFHQWTPAPPAPGSQPQYQLMVGINSHQPWYQQSQNHGERGAQQLPPEIAGSVQQGTPIYSGDGQPQYGPRRVYGSPTQEQEKDVWRHHPYSRGGRGSKHW